VSARVEQQKPGAHVAADDRFHTLAIVPARSLHGFSAAQRSDVRIDEAAQPVGHASSDAREARSAGDENDAGLGGPAESLAGGGIACIPRLCKGLA
jgi:hypothetical protein